MNTPNNVSSMLQRQNRTPFNDINQLANEANRLAKHNFDAVVPMNRLYGLTEGNQADQFATRGLGLNETDHPHPPTRAAFMQLMTRLRSKGGAFLFDQVKPYFPGEMARITNLLLNEPAFANTEGGKERYLLVRGRGHLTTFSGMEEPSQIRAFLSDVYRTMDTHTVLNVVAEHVNELATANGLTEVMEQSARLYGPDVRIDIDKPTPNGGIGHDLIRPYISPDGASVRIRVGATIHTPEDDVGPVSPSMLVKTGDRGQSAVHILPGLFYVVCLNGSFRHLKRGELTTIREQNGGWAPVLYHRGQPADLDLYLRKAISDALMSGTQLVQKARQAAYRTLPNANDIVSAMIAGLVPKEERDAALLAAGAGMRGSNSVMAVINGVTAAAQVDSINQDTADSLEIAGGAALERIDPQGTDKQIARQFFALAKTQMIQVETEA